LQRKREGVQLAAAGAQHLSLGRQGGGQLPELAAGADGGLEDGYTDAIALGPGGLVSEGTGQNVFLVHDGVLMTPSLDGTNLNAITRDCILTVAEDLGIPTREQSVPREWLYTADEPAGPTCTAG
jgi:branched-chain amino acid aminotransferase